MSRTSSVLTRILALTVALLVAEACADRPLPTDATPPPETAALLSQAVSCQADVAAGSIACQRPIENPAPGVSLTVTLGGQGTFVLLASDNVSYDGSAVFQADVTVQNLIAQALATTDGTTLDPDGVRVFFHAGPTVADGTGTVSVANADGTGTFTGANQPYFQYDELLATGETSAAKTWRWTVSPDVITFVFDVYVTAAVQHTEGWVTATLDGIAMRVGDTEALSAVVWDVVGREQIGAEKTYTTTDPSVVTVDAGVVTAVANGTAEIVVASPPCTPDTVAVAVVQTTTPELGYWQSLTEFGGFVFRTGLWSDQTLHVSERTFLFKDWTCGTGTWNIVEMRSGAVADDSDGEFSIGPPWGQHIVYEPYGPQLTVEVIRGLFDASDHVLGNWHIESNGTMCSGSWEGQLATALYLDFDSEDSVTFLTTQRPPPSGSAWIANFASGDTFEWKTELGGPIEDDVYDFVMELAISAEEGPDGVFDVALLVDDGVAEQELASVTFHVPASAVFHRYEDVVRGQPGGAAGDTVILRATFTAPADAVMGGLAFDNPTAANSHALVGGTVPIVELSAPARAIAAASGNTSRIYEVEVTPELGPRWRKQQ